MMKIVREPLFQFLIVGVLVFALHALIGEKNSKPAGVIVISVKEQMNLAALFRKTWQRDPTPEELDGLIENRVGEELFYREALALGLGKNDILVRRRLAQKLTFITDDLASRKAPSDEDLQGYLKANPGKYVGEPALTFRQVFLNADQRGPKLLDHARVLLAELKRGGDPKAMGDPSLLPPSMKAATVSTVARLFGSDFAKALDKAGTQKNWLGPVKSAFGAHLIRIDGKVASRSVTLKEARRTVERDWRADERRKAHATYRESLKRKYKIVIENKELGS
ncbi:MULTISPECIES: peptidylprolyl isomerase [Alphaproteobacteria]|uniref:peptidylprolyl isomerase n=1 Tax=Alphaproteobacteria TaxID=28211 RepID=UPI0032675170